MHRLTKTRAMVNFKHKIMKSIEKYTNAKIVLLFIELYKMSIYFTFNSENRNF